MIIPQSSITPFGVLGFPTVSACALNILYAIHQTANSLQIKQLNTNMNGSLNTIRSSMISGILRDVAIKNGAYSVTTVICPKQSLSNNVIVFNVIFTLVRGGHHYHAPPCYVQLR